VADAEYGAPSGSAAETPLSTSARTKPKLFSRSPDELHVLVAVVVDVELLSGLVR